MLRIIGGDSYVFHAERISDLVDRVPGFKTGASAAVLDRIKVDKFIETCSPKSLQDWLRRWDPSTLDHAVELSRKYPCMAAGGESRAKLHVLETPAETIRTRRSRSKSPHKSWDRVNKPYSARKAPRENRKFSDQDRLYNRILVSKTLLNWGRHQGMRQKIETFQLSRLIGQTRKPTGDVSTLVRLNPTHRGPLLIYHHQYIKNIK